LQAGFPAAEWKTTDYTDLADLGGVGNQARFPLVGRGACGVVPHSAVRTTSPKKSPHSPQCYRPTQPHTAHTEGGEEPVFPPLSSRVGPSRQGRHKAHTPAFKAQIWGQSALFDGRRRPGAGKNDGRT
jgi:hypothetical protein